MRLAASIFHLGARASLFAMGPVAASLAMAPAHRAIAQQQPEATAALSRDSVDLGDSITFQVAIDGAQSAEQPDLPTSSAYQAEFLGGRDESSRSIFIVNGKKTESNKLRYVLQWRITPLKAGRHAIDSFTVKVGRATLTVPRTEFQASEPGDNPNFQLILEPEKTKVYVGEPLRVRMIWSLGRNVRSASFSGPDGGREFDVVPLDPRSLRARTSPNQNNDAFRLVPFLGGQIVITRTQFTREGRDLPAFSADLVITPRRAGKLDIGPYRVAFDEIVGQKSRSFFDSPFDDLSQTRRSVVASNIVTLDVKPLPEEGKPADFSGLIGVYSLDASATNSEANVGDPIPITLTIRGPEPLGDLKAPPLENQPAIASGFKLSPEGWETAPSDGAASGQRTFTTTIRPRSESVTEIPPVRLPYFDSKTGAYAIAQSKPIPLKVHASKEVTLADAMRPGADGAPRIPPAAGPATLTEAPGGIGANTESLTALVDQRVNLVAAMSSPIGAAFVVAPPAALAFVAMLAHRRRTRDPGAAARAQAVRHAKRAASSARSSAELLAAVRLSLAPFLGVAADAVTSRDAAKGSLPGDSSRQASELLRDLEAAAFDAREVELGHAKARAASLFQELSQA